MKKIKVLLLSSLFLLGIFAAQGKAEDSAQMYEDHLRSQQVYVAAYNDGTDTIAANEPVIISNGSTIGTTFGERIQTTVTTDSIFVFGVADESIAPGVKGRICVRGPHKMVFNATLADQPTAATGTAVSTSTTWKRGAIYSTADGTRGGQLGWLMSRTASTDPGDTNVYWIWVNPQVHR